MRPAARISPLPLAAAGGWLLLVLLWLTPVRAQQDPARSASEEITLARRDLGQFTLSDVVLLSTLDGSLQARTRDTGAILWTLESTQLVEVQETGPKQPERKDGGAAGNTTSKASNAAPNSDEARVLWLAEPSAGGGLYFFTPESGIERIPASVQDLVQKAPFGMVGNIVYTGSRHTTLYALDVHTGEVLQAFGSFLDYSNPTAVAAAQDDPMRVIMIGRTEYTLDMHEQLGAPGWRVRIGVWTPNSRDQDLAEQYKTPLDSVYVTPLSNATVMALAENDMRPQRWVSEVPSLLVDVFDVLHSQADQSLALVRQPALKLSGPTEKQNHNWDLYVTEAPDGSAVVVRGPRYSALLGTVARAPYCGTPKTASKPPAAASVLQSIIGVHPAWCQEKRRNPARSPPAMSLLPPSENSNTAYPRLDPPKPQGPDIFINDGAGSAWPLLWRSLALGMVVLGLMYGVSRRKWGRLLGISGRSVGQTVEDEERKRRKRGTRGGKSKKQNGANGTASPGGPAGGPNGTAAGATIIGPNGTTVASGEPLMANVPVAEPPITVSDMVLGYGSHGTTVFKGRFENRDVAVKRMLLEFYDVASQEVDILRESDDHPNVVRYYYKYQTDQFLFIALELCPGTLEELVRGTHQFSILFNPLEALQQIAQGLQHLHNLQIVHRDIKPQNILVALPKTRAKSNKPNRKRVTPSMGVRYLISDFGLCRKLEGDQSSFLPTAADSAAGTAGWAAPEIASITNAVNQFNSAGRRLRDNKTKETPRSRSKSENRSGDRESTPTLTSGVSKGLEDSPAGPASPASTKSDGVLTQAEDIWPGVSRLTKAVDIFSIGCLFYYVLTGGKHPFGDAHMRQVNIMQGQPPVLEAGGLMSPEALDLIRQMLNYDPNLRPTINEVLKHPMFWADQRKLDFLVKVSDRLEHESREEQSDLIDRLEVSAADVVGNDWHLQFPKLFVENLGKYRRYHGNRILDLLRAMRNKLHHYNDFSDELKQCVGQVPQGYLAFFTEKFPLLLVTVFYYAKAEFHDEDAFKDYF